MARKLFGTDGVRGIANQEPMTAETALKLGRAIAYLTLADKSEHHRILVGKDTRISGYMLETALAAGISSMSPEVLLVGTMPTPGIAFLTANMRCDAGAVISASHNPYQDNGIKFFARDGFKLSDEVEERIEELVLGDSLYGSAAAPEKIGRITCIDDALDRYVVFLKSTFSRDLKLDNMRIVLDCANGAAYKAAPMILDELGAQVTTLGASPDGRNINDNCGALYPGEMCRKVRETGADLGIALDGDADRVIFSDEKGNEISGDQIMGLIARDLMEKNRLNGNTLVSTVMSNLGLEKAMREIGVSMIRTPVGDRYVAERMRAEGYNFGGEQSGHLIFLDRSTSGDGILSALQVLRILLETGKPLSELAAPVKMYPQSLKNVEVSERRDFETVPEINRAIDSANKLLGDRGRLLIRYSGTQLLCRVMAEGENEQQVKAAVDMVADAISQNL